MKPFKDFVHRDYMHARRVETTETTDEDILSGVVAMIALGGILGLIMGVAI